MIDPRLVRWADTLVHYSLQIKQGQQLLIRTDEGAIALGREVLRSAVRAGANANIEVVVDGADEILLAEASDDQLDWVSESKRFEYEKIDALCAITAPTNTAALAGIDPARLARAQRANRTVRRSLFERAAAGTARWVLTLFPTPAAAQNAGLSLAAYQEFVLGAMLLDHEDPPASWREFSGRQQRYVDHLNSAEELRFVAADTDIRVATKGRRWLNSDGHRNFPSGEIFTSPLEDSAEGSVRFQIPSSHLGHPVDDVRLTFRAGRVVDAAAARGGTFLRAMLDSDDGASRLGEVAIGNNYAIQIPTRNTLYDEKIGGTFHMALGNSYAEAGGQNQSALHWDLVCDMRPAAGGGSVYADGVLIHQDGQWTI